jgi:adenylate cyclase
MSAHLLVVDDEPDLEVLVLQKFRRQVAAGEFRLSFARDGADALRQLDAAGDIDLVVTDINMPGMDGLTLLSHLQGRDPSLATIVVTAYGDMSNIRLAMNRGAFDFLTKPIDFGDLETTIRKTLRYVLSLREARAREVQALRAKASLSRYFSPGLAEELAAEDSALAVGAVHREITAIFTDITSFTVLVDTTPPPVLAELLNAYFGGMTDVAFAHGGTVAKIIGDAVHVLFGAPREQPDHAARAAACALAMDQLSEELRQTWSARGVDLGATRIGVHSGPALVGNFGGSRFFDYTAYGDTINMAARLQAANKAIGTRLCVSGEVVTRVADFAGRPIGDLVFRGRSEVLRCMEPLHDDAAAAALSAYREAFAKIETGSPDALAAFAALVSTGPSDPLVQYHLRRLVNGGSGTRIELA